MGIEGKSQDDIALYLNENNYTQNDKTIKMIAVSLPYFDPHVTTSTEKYIGWPPDNLFTWGVIPDYLRLRNILTVKRAISRFRIKLRSARRW